MRVDFVRRTPDDVDMAAIGLPSRDTGGEVFVGVGDAAVVLFLKFVDGGVGIGIVVLPEDFNELFAFFVGAEAFESSNFVGREKVFPVFFQELTKVEAEFVFGFLDLFFVRFFGLRFLRGRHGGRVFLSECI